MRALAKIVKFLWSLIFGGKDPVKEVEREAKETVDKVPDGQPMSDFLNKQLRDD